MTALHDINFARVEERTAATFAERLSAAADTLDAAALTQAQAMAADDFMPVAAAYDALTAEFARRLRERRPSDLVEADGRSAQWRVRVRLYDMRAPDDVQADSDPDEGPKEPGASVIAGLPAVAAYLTELAGLYHAGACEGLGESTLRHRLKSLRPTLSRNKGVARWRVPYTVKGTEAWLAVVNVQRETKGSGP